MASVYVEYSKFHNPDGRPSPRNKLPCGGRNDLAELLATTVPSGKPFATMDD
jgi:hypothetical protein